VQPLSALMKDLYFTRKVITINSSALSFNWAVKLLLFFVHGQVFLKSQQCTNILALEKIFTVPHENG
jgi:hypothetical protein